MRDTEFLECLEGVSIPEDAVVVDSDKLEREPLKVVLEVLEVLFSLYTSKLALSLARFSLNTSKCTFGLVLSLERGFVLAVVGLLTLEFMLVLETSKKSLSILRTVDRRRLSESLKESLKDWLGVWL